MELIKISGNSYYIDGVNKIGLFMDNDGAYLIDSGNDSDMGRKINKLLTESGIILKGIISTHSNADHVGGNKFLQDKLNVNIYSTEIENAFIKFSILESSFLYGGFPMEEMKNKFLHAKSSNSLNIYDYSMPFEIIELPGHFFGMIGIKTVDNVYYLSDSLFGENIINKYHIFYIYDVAAFLETLDYLETLNGTFVLSHADVSSNIKDLIKKNRDKVFEIIDLVLDILNEEKTFEDLFSKVLEHYSLNLDINQYILIGSALRSYVSYLVNEKKANYFFRGSKMYLHKTVE